MSEVIDLGTTSDVATLFSYPNNCHEICFISQSLEETIKHYLGTSIQRDGFSDTQVQVEKRDGHVYVTISGDGASAYSAGLRPYLDIGMLAYRGSVDAHAAGKWRYNWRFFLPHGVAMTRHHTVQLLHFPPDYVLEQDQDYLSAHTTRRWADLLMENGIQSAETSRFQNIIDIAPIIAPSSDGRRLEGIYQYYNDFIVELLRLWCRNANNSARPIVAFGSPVRKWIKTEFGPDLSVLSLTTLEIANGLEAPTLAANHPSFIYNAAKRLQDDPDTPEDERMGVLMRIMQQDLIAAQWQAVMGQNPQSDPTTVLNDSKAHWGSPMQQNRICVLARIQALNEDPDRAEEKCGAEIEPIVRPFAGPLDEKALIEGVDRSADRIGQRLEKLRDEIGDLDSREPDQIDDD